MRISDWSSDVCSSDLLLGARRPQDLPDIAGAHDLAPAEDRCIVQSVHQVNRDGIHAVERRTEPPDPIERASKPRLTATVDGAPHIFHQGERRELAAQFCCVSARDPRPVTGAVDSVDGSPDRSEEHTSELQSLTRISYTLMCSK